MKNDTDTAGRTPARRRSTFESDVMGLLNAALRHLHRDPASAAREAAEANELILSIRVSDPQLVGYAVAVAALVTKWVERLDATSTVMFDGQVA